jgi:hypothetical protein
VNRAAEEEHIDDFLRAYRISLAIADHAIDEAVQAGPFAGLSAQEARYAAEALMNAEITAAARDQGSTPFLITDNLDQLYANKVTLSTPRDSNGWHTFRPNMASTSWSPAALLHEALSDSEHEVRELRRGPTMAVGVHPSATHIV